MKSKFTHKRMSIIILIIILVVFAGIAVLTLQYPKKMKSMFVESSLASMESKLYDASIYTNDNVEMNYEEIRLLSGLISKYLDGTEDYSDNVLSILQETKEKAGFTNIGIVKCDASHLFATTSEGRKVQLDIWTIDLDFDKNEVSIELQTSPFRTADEGEDAVVYRYVFQDTNGNDYMLVAEKPQDTLRSILNVDDEADGLTLVIRDNGNVVYGNGSIEATDASSYNVYGLLRELGATEDKIDDIKAQLEEYKEGRFELTVDNEPYYFIFHNIENTNWICMNAYSETAMAGENLAMVNAATIRLVIAVSAVLVIALVLCVFGVENVMKKEGEMKVLQREKLFEEMSRHIPDTFVILKKDDPVPSFVSHNFYEVIREDKFDFSYKGILNWAGIDEKQAMEEGDDLFVQEGKMQQTVVKSDRYFSMGVYAIGVVNDDMYYALVILDVTDEVNSRKLLEDSIKRADSASKSKTQFLSKMSHEIRTPLNSVIGFSRLALDGWNNTSSEELYDYVNKIQISGNYLLDLVSDILDISRIEEGRMQINKAPCSLNAMVDEIVDSFQGQMERKHHQFLVDKNYEDIVLDMDAYHTKQILNNLISNSCKYTEEGGCIGFEISTQKLDKKKMAVQFIVQDTGIGMSKEFIARIFEPFTQDERGMQMKKQLRGSGLGMSICKNLVDLQNGTIKVESEIGEGSCFTVQLTFDIVDDAQTASEKKEIEVVDYGCLRGKKILVVDDVEMNRIVIEKFMKSYGIEFDEAENGQQAVDKFAASKQDEYFAIFMDVNMPVMDGHVATETIRKLDRPDAKSITIAGMTADAFSDDINKCIMCGMNYHISKPVQIEKVLGMLMEVYNKKEAKA